MENVKLQGIPREMIALRISKEIKDGDYVNLGIGIPTLISNWIEGRDIMLQAEIGMLKSGPLVTDEADINQDCINASCQGVIEIPGTIFFDIVESFTMIRGGRMSLVVMGAVHRSTLPVTGMKPGRVASRESLRELPGLRRMFMSAVAQERLVSADSHVMLTDAWIKQRLRKELHSVWDAARQKGAEYNEKVQRAGQPQLHIEDFVDPEASKDPGYSDPAARLKAMDRDGVSAEVLFRKWEEQPSCNPSLMGTDWKEAFHGYNQSMADFAAHNPDRLLCAYQLPLYDVEFAVSEVTRLAKDHKARCVQITPFPAEKGLPDVQDKRYDKLWATIQEAGLSIMNHLEVKEDLWGVFRRDPHRRRVSSRRCLLCSSLSRFASGF